MADLDNVAGAAGAEEEEAEQALENGEEPPRKRQRTNDDSPKDEESILDDVMLNSVENLEDIPQIRIERPLGEADDQIDIDELMGLDGGNSTASPR